MKAWSPNHWIAKEFPKLLLKKKKDIGPCCSILGHYSHFLGHSESSPVKEGTRVSRSDPSEGTPQRGCL